MGSIASEIYRRRRWLPAAAIIVLPIAVVFTARQVFNNIIATSLINYHFADDATLVRIPASVILALYRSGLALCATSTLSVALFAIATYAICKFAPPSSWRWRALMIYLAFLVIVFLLSALKLPSCHESWPSIDRNHLPTKIARQLLNDPLGMLPEEGPEMPRPPRKAGQNSSGAGEGSSCSETITDPEFGGPIDPAAIGSTAHSLARIAVMTLSLLIVAGIHYLVGMALVIGPLDEKLDKRKMEERRAILDALAQMAALTFAVSIVAVDFLFRPGEGVIVAMHPNEEARNISRLADYRALTLALSTYWATILSIALTFSYFGSLLFLSVRAKTRIGFKNQHDVIKQVITVLLPILVDLAKSLPSIIQS